MEQDKGVPAPISARQYVDEFAEGCRQFAAGRWFDAHETWESLWHAVAEGEQRLLLQVLIQSAVCLHHLNRGSRIGAGRMLARLIPRLERLTGADSTTSVDLPELRSRLEALVAAGDAAFAPFAIPRLTQPPPRAGVPTEDPDTQEPPCREPSP